MDYIVKDFLAVKYGLAESVFIYSLYQWICKNEANGRHHNDGKTWTYNTMAAWSELFPFWNKRQVRHLIEKLEADGVIFTGNYNKSAFDRTQWYALSDEVFAMCQIGQIQVTNLANEKCQNWQMTSDKFGTPIPIYNHNNKPLYIKENIKESPFDNYTQNAELKNALQDYLEMRKSIKSPMSSKAIQLLLSKLDKLGKNDAEKIELLNAAIMSNWKSVYPLKKSDKTEPEQKGKSKSYDLEENFKNSWALIHNDDD